MAASFMIRSKTGFLIAVDCVQQHVLRRKELLNVSFLTEDSSISSGINNASEFVSLFVDILLCQGCSVISTSF